MADDDIQNDDLDAEDTDADTDADDADAGDGDAGEADDDAKEPKGEAKRVKDLTSKWQKAEARAAKAEAALKSKTGEGSDTGKDPATTALMAELREASLDAVFGEYPELREYGIDRDLIEGSTRAELRAQAESLVALIKSVSTKARNKALADAGVKAEPAGSTRKAPVDYGSMSDEEFLKLIGTR